MKVILGLVERSSEAAFAIDGEQRIVAWNSLAEGLAGIDARKARGQRCYDLLSGQTEDGRPICSSRCAAAACFRHDRSFSANCMTSMGTEGTRRLMRISSIVLPGQIKRGVPKAIIFLTPLDNSTSLLQTPPSVLRVHALGPLELYSDPQRMEWQKWPRRQAAALFKLLLTRRGLPIHREVVAETLWPDTPPQEGLGSLKVLVHSLRRYLEPWLANGTPSHFIATEGDCYRLLTGDHLWIDVDQFQQLVQKGASALKQGCPSEALRHYQEAAFLYRGDYLAEDPYSDWLAQEREQLRELYVSLLVQMASLFAGLDDHQNAIASCRKALAVDPCRENVHRALMTHLYAAGQRTEAVAQYRACYEILQRELGVVPLPETTRLYQSILQGAPRELIQPLV